MIYFYLIPLNRKALKIYSAATILAIQVIRAAPSVASTIPLISLPAK